MLRRPDIMQKNCEFQIKYDHISLYISLKWSDIQKKMNGNCLLSSHYPELCVQYPHCNCYMYGCFCLWVYLWAFQFEHNVYYFEPNVLVRILNIVSKTFLWYLPLYITIGCRPSMFQGVYHSRAIEQTDVLCTNPTTCIYYETGNEVWPQNQSWCNVL